MIRGDEDYLSLGIPEELLGEGSEELQEELRKYDVTTAGTLVHLPEGVHIGGKDYSGWYLCLDGKNGYMDAANVYLFLKPGEKNLLVRTSLRTVRNPVTGTAKDQKVLLKEYESAVREGDKIYAVIEASAANNDGKTMGITTPNLKAQKEIILTALDKADIDPSTIGYVETHGTGTMIGDPIELKALSEVYSSFCDKKRYCAVGSV